MAENKTGYFGVCLIKPGQPKPYLARVKRGGKQVTLGSFATAEEAALCIARSSEGLTSEEVRQQAQAERLTLIVADNKTGYSCVRLSKPGQPKPFAARVTRGGKEVSLGSFATAEEAALWVARSPEGQALAEKAAVAPPLTSEEARHEAQAQRLTLRVTDNNRNKTGFFRVHLDNRNPSRPFQARVSRGGSLVSLGNFATAEEAAVRRAVAGGSGGGREGGGSAAADGRR